MDAPIKLPQPKNCNKHNQPILLYDPDPKKGGYCLICMQQKTGMISAESYLQKLNVIINQADEQYNQDIQLFQNWHKSIQSYKDYLIQSLDKILKVIVEKMEILGTFRQKLRQLSQSNENEQNAVDDLQLEYQNKKQESELVKQQVKKQLQDFLCKQINNIDQLLSQSREKQKIIIKDVNQDQRTFQYELINKPSRKEENRCRAFAFNKESNIVAVGCGQQIIVYEFNKGVIGKEQQRLTVNGYVNCLLFMNKSNCIISGDGDSIILWEYDNEKNQYFAKPIQQEECKKEFNISFNQIVCILISKDDDLLISASGHNIFAEITTIKFWSKINNSWSCKQTINIKAAQMSLNEFEDKLISAGYPYKLISVMKKGSDNQWSIVQTIDLNTSGARLCFTIGDQFAFKGDGDQLMVYNYSQNTQKFEILNNIKIQNQKNTQLFFPCQYIKEIKLLSMREDSNINLFNVNQDGNYQLIQSIQFKGIEVFGRLTDDGQYLITWDEGSKEIQVRVLKYRS